MKVSLDSNVFISIHNEEPDHLECELILETIKEEDWDCTISAIVLSEIFPR